MNDLLDRAVEAIRNADGLLITAGAGMGVDSGLPDFRGNEGFWQAYPALGRGRVTFMQIANGIAFEENPERSWGFYGHRLNLYRSIVPHEGFAMLKSVVERMPQGAFVYTSNVDGHFQKAGFSHESIMECHGSIHHLQCVQDCNSSIWSSASLSVQVDMDKCVVTSELPRCPHCGAAARPNILMFNDMRWNEQRMLEQEQRFHTWLSKVLNPVVIELGAGVAIPTVRRVGEALKRPLIRINPTAYKVHASNHIGLQMGALEGIKKITERLGS